MSDESKIVVDHYPVEKLPADLRYRIGAGDTVRLTIEADAKPPNQPRPLHELMGSAKGVYATPEEAVAAIRQLRDEWDD